MAKAKDPVKRRKARRAATPEAGASGFGDTLAALGRMAEASANRPRPRENTSHDARSNVLAGLAMAITSLSHSVNNIAAAAVNAPNYTDTESRE